MRVTGTTFPEEGSSYVYRGVVYQRLTEPQSTPRSHHTGFGACLAQGLSVGAVLVFVLTVISLLSSPTNGYNFYVILFFPLILCYGLVPGFVQALVIWLCIRLAGHDLRWFTRLLISALVFAISYAAVLASFGFTYSQNPDLTSYLMPIGIAGAFGAPFGVITGSRLKLWRELVRGNDSVPFKARFVTGFTGLILRAAVVFFLMESILELIVVLQVNFKENDLIFALVALAHFMAAFVITFSRVRFWVLLPLAVLINVPIFTQINFLLTEAHVVFFYLCVGYLSAWAVFLIARCPLTYKALAMLTEEFKYYLID